MGWGNLAATRHKDISLYTPFVTLLWFLTKLTRLQLDNSGPLESVLPVKSMSIATVRMAQNMNNIPLHCI